MLGTYACTLVVLGCAGLIGQAIFALTGRRTWSWLAPAVGLGAGIPFSPSFTGAAVTRPDAPAEAVGFVNSAASITVLVGTPLVGLTLALPGDGRIGFAAAAALWLAALVLLPSRQSLGAGSATAG